VTLRPIRIGTVQLENNLVMAPLAGVTNIPFRLLARESGCGLVCTEMVSTEALVRNNEKTRRLFASDPKEKPLSVQVFGSSPDVVARAAAIVEESGADIVDINMGCPVPKIIKASAGAALLRNPPLVEAILKATVKAVSVPVTVKTRAGWDDRSINGPEIARIAEGCGVQAIAIHARTRSQQFSGEADWSLITAFKEAVSIPVFGNGDVKSPEDARRMLEQTGCDGVMIGRGAVGSPWIFRQIAHYMQTGEIPPPPSIPEKLSLVNRHMELLEAYLDEREAVFHMRKHLPHYTRGLPGAAAFRDRINQIEKLAEVKSELTAFFSDALEFSGEPSSCSPSMR